jgi:hypothetical protein
MEARPGDESGPLRNGRNPWTTEPWTWLRDETGPRIRWWSKPPRGCENLRAERSGKVGVPAHVDSIGDAAKREGTQAGVAARTRSGREERRRNFEEEKRRERMNLDR